MPLELSGLQVAGQGWALTVIRPIALGKKSWLFIGSERSGRSAASIQSLLATAKLNDH